jgi:hypothetical protein
MWNQIVYHTVFCTTNQKEDLRNGRRTSFNHESHNRQSGWLSEFDDDFKPAQDILPECAPKEFYFLFI